MFNLQKQKVIIILGPPGSGKGVQAQLLSDKLSFYYFETSKILEESFAQKRARGRPRFISVGKEKYYFENEKKLWQEGKLCSPPFVTFLVVEKIKQLHKQGKSLIISGSPRTLYEGEKIVPLLKKLYKKENVSVFLLEQGAETSIFRNSHRRICRLVRHPILYSKETANLKKCPLDGSKLLRRKGLDDPKTIKIRLKEYQERTLPLIKLFKKQGLKTRKINGERAVADVFNDILKALKI